LTVNQNSSQPLTGVPANTGGLVEQARAIVAGGGAIYILDDEPITSNGVTSPSQLLPYSVGVNGALLAQTTGVVPDDPTLSNPIYLIVSGKYLYVANQGDNTSTNNGQSGIAGYVINPSTYQLTYIPGEPWGTGGGPQCLVADPSSQFIYTANFNDSTVTGEVIDPNSGTLKSMRVASTYSLTGPATWCVVDGRTS
jgi:6-phosphogluconolactonase